MDDIRSMSLSDDDPDEDDESKTLQLIPYNPDGFVKDDARKASFGVLIIAVLPGTLRVIILGVAFRGNNRAGSGKDNVLDMAKERRRVDARLLSRVQSKSRSFRKSKNDCHAKSKNPSAFISTKCTFNTSRIKEVHKVHY